MSLLDFLNSDDARLGIGLLAAGGYSPTPLSTGQRIAGALQGVQAQRESSEDRAWKRRLLQSQMAENESQNQLRMHKIAQAQQQAEDERRFLGLGGASGGADSAPVGMPGGASAGTGGAPSGPGGAPEGMTAAAIAQRYGMPLDQVIADYKFNGGKKIAEFIGKSREPNWVNVNGNLVNTNAQGFQGGVQGGVSAGNDGRVTAWQPDGRGGLVVGAPRGAFDTYSAYQDIGARTGAAYSPGRPVLGADGRTYGQSQLAEVGAAPPVPMIGPGAGAAMPPAPGRGPVNGQPIPRPMAPRAGDTDRVAIFSQERRNAAQRLQEAQQSGDPAAISRAQSDVVNLEREIQSSRINLPPLTASAMPVASRAPTPMIGPGAGRGVVNPPAGGAAGAIDFSPAEKAAQEAERTRAVEQAKADVALGSKQAEAAPKKATQQRATIDQADRIIEMVRDASSMVGKSSAGLAGPTMANVPGTTARDLRATMGSIKANLGFAELQAMRDNSPTGGALGQVAVQELEALQSTVASLDQGQSPAQLERSLKKIDGHMEKWKKTVQQAASEGPQAAPPAQPMRAVLPSGWSVKVK